MAHTWESLLYHLPPSMTGRSASLSACRRRVSLFWKCCSSSEDNSAASLQHERALNPASHNIQEEIHQFVLLAVPLSTCPQHDCCHIGSSVHQAAYLAAFRTHRPSCFAIAASWSSAAAAPSRGRLWPASGRCTACSAAAGARTLRCQGVAGDLGCNLHILKHIGR